MAGQVGLGPVLFGEGGYGWFDWVWQVWQGGFRRRPAPSGGVEFGRCGSACSGAGQNGSVRSIMARHYKAGLARLGAVRLTSVGPAGGAALVVVRFGVDRFGRYEGTHHFNKEV